MNIQYIHAKDDNIQFHDSIVVSIPACHAGDRGSIPRRGAFFEKFILMIISGNAQTF